MIIVRLYGGLSNQLFQYATGLQLAHKNRTDLKVDTSWYDNLPQGDTPRKYELSSLKIKATRITAQELTRYGIQTTHNPGQRLASLVRRTQSGMKRLDEPANGHYLPAIERAASNTYLNGYWQDVRYVSTVHNEMREQVLPRRINSQAKSYLKQVQACDSVAIQVRRGDYLTDRRLQNVLQPLPIAYYKQAVEYLRQQPSGSTLKFFITSDDIDWCREHFDWLGQDAVFLDISGAQRAAQELHVIRNCNHHIIANSTFGWWAAWLADNTEQQVVMPKQWFVNDKIRSRQLVVKGWKRL